MSMLQFPRSDIDVDDEVSPSSNLNLVMSNLMKHISVSTFFIVYLHVCSLVMGEE